MRTQILNWRQRCRTRKVGSVVRFQFGLKTAGLCPVRVTNPPRQSGSGFWPGNVPNRVEPPAINRTAGWLPGPIANTTHEPILVVTIPGVAEIFKTFIYEMTDGTNFKLGN